MTPNLIPIVAAVLIYTFRVIELATRRQLVAGSIRENLTLRLFIGLGTVMLLGSVSEYVFLHKAAVWPLLGAGAVVALFSFWLRRRAIAALGRFWSLHVEIRGNHELVREGPFRWVRHPAYLSMILEILSIGLILQSWGTMLLVYALFLPTLFLRIRIEEAALVEKFGQSYLDFQRETPALFPLRVPRA